MLLVDSHCHLDLLDYTTEHQDLADVIRKAQSQRIGHLLSVATTLEGFVQFRPQVEAYPEISLACGVHPLNITAATAWDRLYRLAADPKVVALGETGLDYYYHTVPTEQQRHGLCQHITVARQLKKPLIIHLRQAEQDLLTVLREQQASECGGVIHCFTGDRATAEALLDLGFYISLSGIVTFKNAEALREVATFIPADRLLIETDSPYLAPIPYRGKPNQPAYLRAVAEFLASCRGESIEQLAETTTKNFNQLFQSQNA
ncbi:MAG: YchF/TatD family DNA exonuclease [Candidatus Symbiodolus clandestinus]